MLGVAPVVAEPHPLLDAVALLTAFPVDLGALETPSLAPLLSLDATSPFTRTDVSKVAVRDLLRHGGFKPAGRSKPASEYLVGAASKGRLGPINPAVDACNVASLHSGLPISVVDVGRAAPPFTIGIALPGSSYVFNASGQQIDLAGLLVLSDAKGPCANAVKDCQRTKTHDATTRTLSIVWGTTALAGRADATAAWYRELLEQLGARTSLVEIS